MSALIFDRTQADADRAAYLIGKIQRREMLTEAEQAEYNAGLRGCYNITDLNRVEAKVRELAETLRSYGYSVDYTVPMKGGSRLPSGYTELESIEGTGTQYIDTGVSPTKSTKFQFAITMKALTGDVIIGDMTNDNNDYRIFNYQGAVYWDMSSSRLIAAANSLPVGERAEFEVGNNYVKKNGIMLVSGDALTALSIPQTIHVFGTGQGTCKAVIEYLTIWESDTRVRDFIPCKNPSGTVGLYDTVNDTFYGNSGTGTFAAGPEISVLEDREWQYTDTMLESDVLLYLANIAALRDVIKLPPDVPPIPTIDRWIDWVAANDIERIVYELDRMIYGIVPLFRRCGTFRAGKNAQHLLLAKGVN